VYEQMCNVRLTGDTARVPCMSQLSPQLLITHGTCHTTMVLPTCSAGGEPARSPAAGAGSVGTAAHAAAPRTEVRLPHGAVRAAVQRLPAGLAWHARLQVSCIGIHIASHCHVSWQRFVAPTLPGMASACVPISAITGCTVQASAERLQRQAVVLHRGAPSRGVQLRTSLNTEQSS
jgi:hypothetical protein